MTSHKSEPCIRLRGVRQNNLKNFDLDLPMRRLVVITGLSGSGKSSLAFDTLYAEGQRRYIETFSPYARQFFDRMDKPKVDRIDGIPPAIAIEQRNSVKTTRSTVGTMTEICDHMKVLWPVVAKLHCRQCGREVSKETAAHSWKWLQTAVHSLGINDVLITFDLPKSEKLGWVDTRQLISKQGYQRLWVNGEIVRLEDAQGGNGLSITVVQDRLKLASGSKSRFLEACEQAFHFGKGKLALRWQTAGNDSNWMGQHLFSQGYHCATCDLDYKEPTAARFSFNHPLGACPECRGFGRVIKIDYNLAVPNRQLTIAGGLVKPWQTGMGRESQSDLMKFCRAKKIPTNVPFCKLSDEQQKWVIEGDPDYGSDEEHEWPRAWYGVRGYFRWLETKAYKMHVRVLLARYRAYTLCHACQGTRFQSESLLYTVELNSGLGEKQTLSLPQFYALSVSRALSLVSNWANSRGSKRGDPITLVLSEVLSRLRYLEEVGLGYLTLDRPTRTLSGGETERVNLTTCLGTRLVNTLFVLDEPSVGLHPRDTERLIKILERLRDQGNTVVVVEHEASVIRAADWLVDLGPGQGEKGGQVIYAGVGSDITRSQISLTGQYLGGTKCIKIPTRRPVPKTHSHRDSSMAWLKLEGATLHNLKNVELNIPLGRLVCVTGVSGSGKTTLVREVLMPSLEAKLGPDDPDHSQGEDTASEKEDRDEEKGEANVISASLTGWELISEAVMVDQSALGRTPRSNPAVYIGAFEPIRELYAETEQAKQLGLNASGFSFNSSQGQCERCRGAGFEKVEMQFLSDVYVRCAECKGRRYREHILQVKLRSPLEKTAAEFASEGAWLLGEKVQTDGTPSALEWSIADMLDATVNDAISFLTPLIKNRYARRAFASLQILQQVGLGYLRLGQPINTLSGGESQRLKLVSHVAESGLFRNEVTTPARIGEGTLDSASSGRNASRSRSRTSLGTSDGEDVTENGEVPRSLFILDEPTTGLHFDDVRVLLEVFQRLVEAGHTVLVIEHNMDVIKCADWVIDLGPGAGEEGGEIVAEGTPEDITRCATSQTGKALKSVLKRRKEVAWR